MSVQTIINTIAPHFSDNPNLQSFIDLATNRTNLTQFGSKYELAIALRVAHEMTIYVGMVESSGGFAYGGVVTSETEGDLSRSFGGFSTSSSNIALGTTTYGQQLQSLIKSTVIRAVVIN